MQTKEDKASAKLYILLVAIIAIIIVLIYVFFIRSNSYTTGSNTSSKSGSIIEANAANYTSSEARYNRF